jgi:hypothetical protein
MVVQPVTRIAATMAEREGSMVFFMWKTPVVGGNVAEEVTKGKVNVIRPRCTATRPDP